MRTKDIKNGSLYYNLRSENRVERVISNNFSNTRVVTECHKKDHIGCAESKLLRLASTAEVESYLTAPPKRGILSFLFGKPAQKRSVLHKT